MANSSGVWIANLTGTQIIGSNSGRVMLSIENQGPNKLFLATGSAGLTVGTGIYVPTSKLFRTNDVYSQIWGIGSGGSTYISYYEESNT